MSIAIRVSEALLNDVFGKAGGWSAPANYFIVLSTADPGRRAATLAEPSGGSYAAVSTAASDWTVASDADPSVISNANAVTFPTATGSWGTVTHFAIFDHATTRLEANYIGSGALTTPQGIGTGNEPEFAIGALVINSQD